MLMGLVLLQTGELGLAGVRDKILKKENNHHPLDKSMQAFSSSSSNMLFRGSNMLSCTYFCLYLSQYRPQSSEKFTPVLLSVGNTFGPHTCPACYKGWGEIGGCFCLGHTAFRGRSEASLSLSYRLPQCCQRCPELLILPGQH